RLVPVAFCSFPSLIIASLPFHRRSFAIVVCLFLIVRLLSETPLACCQKVGIAPDITIPPGRADPDVSLSSLPYHLQCPAQYPPLPSETPLAADRHGALGAGRRTRPFRRRAGLRLSTSHYYEVADSCWRARTNPARALLLPSPDPAPAAG